MGIYRKGLLNDAELDRQLMEIDQETGGLTSQIEELELKLEGIDSTRPVLENTQTLLTRLRERLDQPLTWGRKRQLIELLVGGIRIETIRGDRKPEN